MDSALLFPHDASAHWPDIDYPSPDPSPSYPDPPFSQIQSSIGPTRALPRRHRAVLDRRASLPSPMPPVDRQPSPRHHSAMYLGSRPNTPARLSVNIPLHPYHPPTPSSSSPYTYFNHSRHNSSSNSSNPRSASPALSSASALTSVSSSASGPNTHTFAFHHGPVSAPRPNKQKKQRLYNQDRKNICLYHLQYPNARQEDIAAIYGVERSTISKILKQQDKWLNVSEHESLRIAKHRPSKFPEIEEELALWLEDCSRAKITLTDTMIRTKAKETARKLHITDEKFKASSGWVENFKHRHGIRGGIWTGDGKNALMASASSHTHPMPQSTDSASLNPTFDARLDHMASNLATPGMDLPMDSPDVSPEPEELHNPSNPPPASITLQPAWPDHSAIHDSSHLVSHQHLSSTSPDTQPPSLHLHDAPEQQYTHHYAATEGLEVYEPVPRIPNNAPQTLADAEEAINRLCTFLDTTGHGLVAWDDRQALNTIKRVLFQAASGVPFDRN